MLSVQTECSPTSTLHRKLEFHATHQTLELEQFFHRYPDGSKRSIANASKTLSATQQRYSQIQKKTLAVVFAPKKFDQYGRRFILVTGHKPLVSMFRPTKGTPAMAANRLAQWTLLLRQYEYRIEYGKTTDHGNADALSRLPAGTDVIFDREEDQADTSTVCLVKHASLQLDPVKPKLETLFPLPAHAAQLRRTR